MNARRAVRLLFLQNSSVFESFGGIEYYVDDLLTLATETWGPGSVEALVPRRTPSGTWPARGYRVTAVPFTAAGPLRPLQNRYSPRYFTAACHAIRRFRPSALVCAHVSLAPMTYTLARLYRIPYFVIAYGIEVWGNLLPPDELALKAADGIFSISHWTKRVLTGRGYRDERIRVIQPRLPSAYEQCPVPDRAVPTGNVLRLLTVSRLDGTEQYKGHDHVLEALGKLRTREPMRSFRYRIQGDGSDRPRLEALARERGVADIVDFVGAVRDREEIESAYRESDLYVMPSRFGRWDGRWRGEGFGIVYLEAAAFGVPSLAYDCGGATDIIRPGMNGLLLPPDDIDALADALFSLAGKPERATDMGRKAYEIVMAEFTRPAIAKQLVAATSTFGLR